MESLRLARMWTRVGSTRLPEGRFISAKTGVNGQTWTIVGMCIPYHAYRTNEKPGASKRLKAMGRRVPNMALREDVLAFVACPGSELLLGRLQFADTARRMAMPRLMAGMCIPTTTPIAPAPDGSAWGRFELRIDSTPTRLGTRRLASVPYLRFMNMPMLYALRERCIAALLKNRERIVLLGEFANSTRQ